MQHARARLAMDFKDYYSTLGVAKTATEKEIKQAFRKLARKHHPDVNPGDKAAEAKFKEINEAYEVLGDPEKRKKYDELGANWRMYEQAGAAGAPARRRPAAGTCTSAAAAGGGGFRTMTEEEMREMFGDERSVLRLLPHVLRRRRRTARTPAAAGARPGRGRAAHGPRRRAGDRAGARGRVSRHDAAAVDQARRPGAHGRRADSRRRRRRLARARRRRRRARDRRRAVGRSVPAHPAGAASAVRAEGPRPLHARAVPLTTAVLGGEAEVTDARRASRCG